MASGLLAVFRDGERQPGVEAPATGGPAADDPATVPAPAPATVAAPAGPAPADAEQRLERTVVALGRRTEALAAHLERLEGRVDRLADVPARPRRTGTA
jgi:hypothetical protein